MAAPRPARDLVLLALCGALLVLPGLGRRDLWNPDEARYAEVAREMLAGGDLVVPHLNGEIYTQKPPLFFWSIALAGTLGGGLNEFTARLPVALAGVGTLLLVFAIGHRLFGRRAALLAAAAFITCAEVFWHSRFGQIDMLLTFWVTLEVWLWLSAWREDRPALSLAAFAVAGVATITKGPVGLLPPLLSLLAFFALTRQWRAMRRLWIGRGLLVWAAVVLAWLVPVSLSAGREYVEHIVFTQNVTRYADPWHHHQPWYYYLTVIPAEFFPWSFLLPTAIVVGWRRLVAPAGIVGRQRGGEEGDRQVPADWSADPLAARGFLFALCWMVVTVLFFSLSPAKRTVYVLTMYPAMALMVGAALDRLAAEWPRGRRWLTLPLALLAGLVLLLVVALPVAGRGRPEALPLGGDALVWLLMAVLVPLLAGAVAGWWLARRDRPDSPERAATALAAGMAATALAAALFVIPRFDVVKSARPMSRLLLQKMGPGEPYGIYPRLDSTFLYYTQRFAVPLESEEELHAFAAGPGRVWLLAQRDDLAKLTEPLPLVEVARDPDESEGYVLLTTPPAPR